MKPLSILSLCLAAGLLAVSCIIIGNGASIVGHCTEDGIDYTEVRDVKPFRALVNSLPCNVYYERADQQEVRVETTEKFADKVLTEVEDGTLSLKLKEGTYPELILRIVITSPDIESIKVSGSGNLINKGGLYSGKDLDLKISGSGDIRTGNIDCKDFTAHCSGSGNLNFDKIACTGFSGTVTGSGNISAQLVLVDGDASVRVSGSGRVRLEEVDVDGDMDLKTSGSGDIVVNGSCHAVTAHSSGSGDISGNLSNTGVNARTTGSGRVRL